jgi:hypothetical protein
MVQAALLYRVVHEGCKAALQEHVTIRHLRQESEGSAVTVAVGYAADEYRFIGKFSGAGPFSGTLVPSRLENGVREIAAAILRAPAPPSG